MLNSWRSAYHWLPWSAESGSISSLLSSIKPSKNALQDLSRAEMLCCGVYRLVWVSPEASERLHQNWPHYRYAHSTTRYLTNCAVLVAALCLLSARSSSPALACQHGLPLWSTVRPGGCRVVVVVVCRGQAGGLEGYGVLMGGGGGGRGMGCCQCVSEGWWGAGGGGGVGGL